MSTKKSEVSKEEWARRKEEWKQKLKESGDNVSEKERHWRGLKAMQNEVRRKILQFIGYGTKKTEEIMNEIQLDEQETNYHLSIIEQAMFIERVEKGWRATPPGIGYLKNVEWVA